MKSTILGALMLSIIGSAAAQDTGWPNGSLSAPGGRFVFGQINRFPRDRFLLDTQTGRLWQMVCTTVDSVDKTKCNEQGLMPMAFLDEVGAVSGTTPPGQTAPKPRP